jgi:Na+/H+ antiporter NhaC
MKKGLLIGGASSLIIGLFIQLYKTKIVIQLIYKGRVPFEYLQNTKHIEASGILKNLGEYQMVNTLSVALILIGIVLIIGGALLSDDYRNW